MEIISLPPNAPVLMEATRAIGYSLETAIADLLDNCITAEADTIDIYFSPFESEYLAIIDNGNGMSKEELIAAMRYGSSNPLIVRRNEDLGRFGLGMKTASLSQCRKLTVISKKDKVISAAQWDLDYIFKTGEWSLKLLSNTEIEKFKHFDQINLYKSGTIIYWEELDRLKNGNANLESTMGHQMDKVREHLALVFHRYIKGELSILKTDIRINQLSIDPIDPFISSKSTIVMDDEIIIIDGEKIIVSSYTLPHISKLNSKEITMLGGKEGLRKQQGFYIYRNKRLIIWGTWFRLMSKGELSKLARVKVDIPNTLDNLWTLDIKKSVAIPPESVRKNLSNIIERIANSSKRTWQFRGKKETDETCNKIWNRNKTRDEGIYYGINRDHPMLKKLITKNNNNRNFIESLLLLIEREIPINQIFLDLTNDQKFNNEVPSSHEEILKLIRNVFNECENEDEINNLRMLFSSIEPYKSNFTLIELVAEEAKKNVK